MQQKQEQTHYSFRLCAGNKDSVKPAGQQSDFRAIAAMAALRQLHGNNFVGIGGLWTGCLLQEAHVYREKFLGKLYVSLGFQNQAVMVWELETVGDPCRF